MRMSLVKLMADVMWTLFLISAVANVAQPQSSPVIMANSVVPPQNPSVWDSLAILQGKRHLTTVDTIDLLRSGRPDVDYPILDSIPVGSFQCAEHQPGFYADMDTRCQVIRRCDTNSQLWSYLCPNMTVFNQISLVCDWWFNVDCRQSIHFYDYSNSRLYRGQDVVLLDNQDIIEIAQMVEDDLDMPRKTTKAPQRRMATTTARKR
ncbi:uncharacterized protein LOC129591006 [Paramacrobiotus metropolitanus]|uniref:uncharacterized protein LOC129591006 n=1 Tax=Paramacrobiotus metropolitanus TaxID=2943436 RepID=UPI00244616A5|nr:uncharacterized protein LOC129591006 [Paramacrobiotus metropolitanus]